MDSLRQVRYNVLQPFLQQFSSKSDINVDMCSTTVGTNVSMNKLNKKTFSGIFKVMQKNYY